MKQAAGGPIVLGQPVFPGMATGPIQGEVEVSVEEFDVERDGVTISMTFLHTAMHVGTHLDAPRHFLPGAATIDELAREQFYGPAVVLDVRRDGVVPLTAAEIEAATPAIEPGDMVFLCFGYGRRFREPGYWEHPYLTEDAAQYLVAKGVTILGVDTLTPDVPARSRGHDFGFPVHTTLFRAGALIIENLGEGLEEILGTRVTVAAFPLVVAGADGAPVVPLAFPANPGGSP